MNNKNIDYEETRERERETGFNEKITREERQSEEML